MPNLNFQVDSAEVVRHAATPLIALKLRVSNTNDVEPIQSIMLQCQVRIEPARRHYQPEEQERLVDLFGEPSRWGTTLKSMLWTQVVALVPPFLGSVTIDLNLPCTFDFNVAATKYFHGLNDGEVPLNLLFSGTVFYPDDEGQLRVCQIPWEKEAAFRLPIRIWKEMMDFYYPNIAWLALRRDVFDMVAKYKSAAGIPTWEQAIEGLVAAATEGAAS